MFRSLTKCHFSARLKLLRNHLVRHQLSTLNVQQSSTPPNPNLKASLNDLNFINTAVKALPIDPNPSNKTRLITGYNYSKVTPTPRDNPRIVSTSAPALELLDLDKTQIEKNPENVLYLSGNRIPSKAEPIAHCYCGHQFGSFAGQLGDGRAISLGDIKNNKGEIWELQLKGAGETPYSRFADGKAVLRSSIREYLCSEAMWALGIPTTRAASLVVTDTLADRDQFYNGNVKKEKCALVLRLSPTFWRFGSFEIFKPYSEGPGREGPSAGLEEEMMPNMLNYILNTFYPEIAKLKIQKQFTDADCWLEMFNEITRRTAKLVALWQCYGFCHGVLNTDNMSVLGLTIDYGPFGWMDYFNKRHICNTSDHGGRYSYENQPQVCKWNLWKLGEALDPFVPFEKSSAYIESEYDSIFKEHYYSKMREKLGLYWTKQSRDEYLIDELFDEMHLNASDFTNTFRLLATVPLPKNASESNITSDLIKKFVDLSPDLDVIASRQKPIYTDEQIMKLKDVAKNNPQLLQMWGISPEIIEKEEQRLHKYKEYLQLDDQQRKKDIEKGWTDWLKKYETRLLAETQEDSNKTFEELQHERVTRMNKTNPAYVLRNFIAEEVIRQANKNDFSGVNDVLELLLNPFEIRNEERFQKYTRNPPKWAAEICVSCSS